MLNHLLKEVASEHPDRVLLHAPGESVTYTEMVRRSEELADGLRQQGVARAGCLLEDPTDLIQLMIAAADAGVELSPYPPADPAGARGLARRLGHEWIIADHELDATTDIGVLGIDHLREAARGSSSLRSSATRPSAAPLVLLTSGTTGPPKAARHDWGHLVAGARRRRVPIGGIWLLGYNLSQFAGIQVLIHVLLASGTLVVPRSQHAADVLDAMQRFKVDHASGTPTFWRMLMSLLDAEAARDLPLRQITLGGEAISASLLERLNQLFPDARVSQVYASTEFGSAVSVRDGRAGLPAAILERDEEADVQFKVIDGELYVRSRVGMLGYLGDTEPAFEWRSTGDLVDVVGDRLVFVGRAGETINVGGVKVSPLPVEHVVERLEGVALVRAYGKANPVTGQIVALDVVPREGVDRQALKEQIRQACSPLPPTSQPRLIRVVDEMEMRGSKLARSAGGDI